MLLKLARGHAAYELNEPQFETPSTFYFKPLSGMSPGERQEFEEESDAGVWPEVGSRAMNRLLILGTDVFDEGWLVVQDGRYRYRTSQNDGLTVKLVIREYLACEVRW